MDLVAGGVDETSSVGEPVARRRQPLGCPRVAEGIGGERNWDYRYTWLRDSAFTVFALERLGFTEEVTRFAEFLNNLARHPDEDRPLQIMYGIDGRKTLTEETLDHLEGYCGSRPVRIGNGAYDQLQLEHRLLW